MPDDRKEAKRRGKSLKAVITFNAPTDAFAFESACRKQKMPGRLLPVPVALTNGCGIGWASEAQEKDVLENFIAERGLKIKSISLIEF